jgi:5-methylcytosine-specific restriction endonuclease McrA
VEHPISTQALAFFDQLYPLDHGSLGSKVRHTPAVKRSDGCTGRAFSDNMKREAYERQKGICPACDGPFALDEMEADHKTPWSQGGRTIADSFLNFCASSPQ